MAKTKTKKIEGVGWSTVKKKVADLHPWKRNPNVMSDRQFARLGASMKEFGYAENIVININNIIIGGYHRWKQLKSMKVFECDVRVPSRLLTDKEVDKLGLLLNATGDMDRDILLKNWNKRELLGIGLTRKEIPTKGKYSDFDMEDGGAAAVDKSLELVTLQMLPEDVVLLDEKLRLVKIKYAARSEKLSRGLKLGVFLRGLDED